MARLMGLTPHARLRVNWVITNCTTALDNLACVGRTVGLLAANPLCPGCSSYGLRNNQTYADAVPVKEAKAAETVVHERAGDAAHFPKRSSEVSPGWRHRRH